MERQQVHLYLPRFKINWGAVDIGDQLTALGMPLAFSWEADFSGINGHQPPHQDSLFISRVLHKAMVDMNEEGTEAAAATAVVGLTTGATGPLRGPVPIFRADHPFLFAIRERQTGAILFLGRMADPTREG
jgi:serpin B